jgi:putative copper export protein
VKAFAEWLSTTSLSVYFQEQNAWFIPAVQSVHIVAITMLVGSVLMINLRLLKVVGMDQTLRQTANRFGPWLTSALGVLLASGILLIIGEPARELVTFSFWFKMFLVAVGTVIAVMFRIRLNRQGEALADSRSIKSLAILTLLIWIGVIFLGRLIAYDHIWGAWSPAEKA